jgi:uncharacterized protein (DUF1501 family)
MRRRDFLKLTPAASLAVMINGLPISTFAEHPLLRLLAKQTLANGRVIVLIQLNGGNDGLNMVIPIDQYSALSTARSNILIPQSNVLSLNGTINTVLHPAMTGIRNMYNNGLVNIIQGVSYPNPNFSHFRATDIWLTGSDSNQYLNSGWLGRYLDDEYPGFPVGFPNATMPDPLAIQIGTGVSTVVQGSNMSLGMAISDINSFYNIVNSTVDPAPNTPAGHELTFIRYIAQQTQQYTGVIQTAAGNASNLSTQYPANNSLADQLKIVARLVAGGLQTPVYVVSLGGFDTHSTQVDVNDHTIGVHANLMKQLSEAVSAFFDDLHLLNIDNRVAAMTFSEFGRRIVSNASGGTDHGTAEPVMVFSPHVNPGFIGSNPVIPANVTAADNLPMQNDYRGVYAAILADWFQVPATTMNNILLQPFGVLPVFNGSLNIDGNTTNSEDQLSQNYPNPFRTSTTISFSSEGGMVTIQLFDVQGRLLRTIINQEYQRGRHELTIYRDGIPAGEYFYRIKAGKDQSTRKMIVLD